MPIDINQLRADRGGDPEKWRENQRKRFAPVELVDQTLAFDDEWRSLETQIRDDKKELNALKKAIGLKKRAKEECDDMLAQKVEMEAAIKAKEVRRVECREQRDATLVKIANETHPDVVVDKDEAKNPIKALVGGKPRPQLPEGKEVLHHHELLAMIDGYEPERGVNVAGHRGYFLKGDALRLSLALIQFGLDFLRQRNYTLLQPPYFMNRAEMSGVAQLQEFDEALYKVTGEAEDDDKYLIATAEQPLCVYHKDDHIHPKRLPLRYAGYSSCFRKEAGSHGRDNWGIFRVHQFEKVEQFVVAHPEQSWEMMEEMITAAREFYDQLGLAYRVVDMVSFELNNAAARKYDLEAWFPGYAEYRELVSCSNCTDYQSRAMNIQLEGGEKGQHVHLLNATLMANTRVVCCILENYQTEDGVRVPEALVPFMGGTTFIPFTQPKPVFKVPKSKGKKGGSKKADGGAKKAQGGGEAAAGDKPAAAAGAGGEAKPKQKQQQKGADKKAQGGGKKAQGGGKKAQGADKKAQGGGKKAQGGGKKAQGGKAATAPVGQRSSLADEAGMAALDRHLATRSYINGFEPSKEDVAVYKLVLAACAKAGAIGPAQATVPAVARWFRHIGSFSAAEQAGWTGAEATDRFTA